MKLRNFSLKQARKLLFVCPFVALSLSTQALYASEGGGGGGGSEADEEEMEQDDICYNKSMD